jgi:hypothetical protein
MDDRLVGYRTRFLYETYRTVGTEGQSFLTSSVSIQELDLTVSRISVCVKGESAFQTDHSIVSS